jgi:hypothetical protein
MNRGITSAAVALALRMTVSSTHAFGNAGKQVNFSVSNDRSFSSKVVNGRCLYEDIRLANDGFFFCSVGLNRATQYQ